MALAPAFSASTGTVVTTCRDISQPGNYVLGADLTAPSNGDCLTIHDTANVELDCQQHSISIDPFLSNSARTAVRITNVNGYSIQNCKLVGLNTTRAAWATLIVGSNSPRGNITNNTVLDGIIDLTASDNTTLANNTSNSAISVAGNNATIEYNTLSMDPAKSAAFVLRLMSSSGSVIQNNTISGGWDGVIRQYYTDDPGSDNALALTGNLTNVTVRNNTFSNTWGCAIESNAGLMSNVQITNNQINTAGICGIGGCYGISLKNVTISGNVVTDTPLLFNYFRLDGVYAGERVYFQGNTFSANRLVNPRMSIASAGSSRVDLQTLPSSIPASALSISDNTFLKNDFGPVGSWLNIAPASAMLDGGGNICTPYSTPAFQCTAPSASTAYYGVGSYPGAGAVIQPGAQLVVMYGANPPAFGDYIALASVTADDQHFITTIPTSGARMNMLAFMAPLTPGQYEFRYMKAGASARSAVSAAFNVGMPVIRSFTLSPAKVTAGQSTQLAWEVTGATSVTLDNGIGSVTNTTSRIVTPSQTTTYTLTASSAGGSVTARATVTVLAAAAPPTTPVLTSATVTSASQADLSWSASSSTLGIQSYQILRNGNLLATVTGSALSYADKTVLVAATYTYAVKAVDTAGTSSGTSNSITVVMPPAAAAIVTGTCGAPGNNVFTACYYNNLTLSGTVAATQSATLVNYYAWPGFLPAAVTPQNFSASWEGNFNFESATYAFVAYTLGGMRVYVDGVRIIDRWQSQGLAGYSSLRTMTQGSHLIRIEYFNQDSAGMASVYWIK